jgi:site-specific recombinase XerD
MKGSIKWQVTEIFKEIKNIGASKHEAKNQARIDGAHGSHGIAEKTGIYSNGTSTNYRNAVELFGTWAKTNLHLKDLTKTTVSDLKAYLDYRISQGVVHKTFELDKAALNKFETALNKYSQNHNLNRTYEFKLNETFKSAHKDLVHADVRAYSKTTVDKLLNIQDKAVNLAMRCALNAGLRKSEILKLSANNLKENSISVIGAKGGKDRLVAEISDKSLISDIKAFLKENNIQKFGDAVTGTKINNKIRAVLGDSGSIHALRHNYAIDCIKAFEKAGYSHVEAVHMTSVELGHNRNEIITGVYSK